MHFNVIIFDLNDRPHLYFQNQQETCILVILNVTFSVSWDKNNISQKIVLLWWNIFFPEKSQDCLFYWAKNSINFCNSISKKCMHWQICLSIVWTKNYSNMSLTFGLSNKKITKKIECCGSSSCVLTLKLRPSDLLLKCIIQ